RSQVKYWPALWTCSARPTTCHERAKTVCRSNSKILGSTYHEAGAVEASASGTLGSYASISFRSEGSMIKNHRDQETQSLCDFVSPWLFPFSLQCLTPVLPSFSPD